MQYGDQVIRNPATWIPSEFDQWGAGVGLGIVLAIEGDSVDVRWKNGRAWQRESELIVVETMPCEVCGDPATHGVADAGEVLDIGATWLKLPAHYFCRRH